MRQIYAVLSCAIMMASMLATVGRSAMGAPQGVTLVKDGRSHTAIYVTERVMGEDKQTRGQKRQAVKLEQQRRRLRESVRDLALYIEKMSGGTAKIHTGESTGSEKTVVPVFIGELAEKRFGQPQKKCIYDQGFRIVVKSNEVGLIGESDLATSYAIYTLLHDLGCRWYMPGEIGEFIPKKASIVLPIQDTSNAPFTYYRGIWYADDAYKRRNRMGGLRLNAGHALERYITAQQREEHPDWQATINGKPHHSRLKWSHPGVANAIADALITRQDKDYVDSLSLSPGDGAAFDESAEDRALDAGDIDPTMNVVSLTDRFLSLTNRIAEKVTAKHPDTLFGMLAYVQYTRPPLREKVHPAIIPQIAPITYSRHRPMSDTQSPDGKNLLELVEGWGQKARFTSYYAYAYNLADTGTPCPFLTKWGSDTPIVFANNCRLWQPETTPNFETAMHALYMANRLAWDPGEKPHEIYDEINANFYGAAAEPMSRYWKIIDDAWIIPDDHSGCTFGHLRRFTPEVMKAARQAIDDAIAACNTAMEYRRVEMVDWSLRIHELFMKMKRDLAEGRFTNLAADADLYMGTIKGLAKRYAENHAFSGAPWTRDDCSVNVRYFKWFSLKTYEDATRIADRRSFAMLTRKPLRDWKILADVGNRGLEAGWQKVDFDDKSWAKTDVAVDTWSAIGYHDYFGPMWYRTSVQLPAIPKDKKVFLWIAATDGPVRVFVNSKHVPFVNDDGESLDEATGYCKPFSFDITSAIEAGQQNVIALRCTRSVPPNEIGVGGLLGPAAIYRQK